MQLHFLLAFASCPLSKLGTDHILRTSIVGNDFCSTPIWRCRAACAEGINYRHNATGNRLEGRQRWHIDLVIAAPNLQRIYQGPKLKHDPVILLDALEPCPSLQPALRRPTWTMHLFQEMQGTEGSFHWPILEAILLWLLNDHFELLVSLTLAVIINRQHTGILGYRLLGILGLCILILLHSGLANTLQGGYG